jgi:hypothetical protein
MKKINCETENKQVFGKIEKNIPMSSSVHQVNERSKLAKEMEIGDSVLFENRRSAEKFAGFMRRQFKKAAVRKQPDGTARVWYVADVRDLILAKNK